MGFLHQSILFGFTYMFNALRSWYLGQEIEKRTPRSLETRLKYLSKAGREISEGEPTTSRLNLSVISPPVLPPARSSVTCKHHSNRLPAQTFLAYPAEMEGLFGCLLCMLKHAANDSSASILPCLLQAIFHTSHEVQHPSDAQGLGRKQTPSTYMQRPRKDLLPCTCHCHG